MRRATTISYRYLPLLPPSPTPLPSRISSRQYFGFIETNNIHDIYLILEEDLCATLSAPLPADLIAQPLLKTQAGGKVSIAWVADPGAYNGPLIRECGLKLSTPVDKGEGIPVIFGLTVDCPTRGGDRGLGPESIGELCPGLLRLQ